MNLNEKYIVEDEFASLFEFKSEKDEIKHDAYILMFKFLSEIERLSEGTFHQKDLAKALDTSTSFISQLFSGNKLASLITLAKLQKSYGITFQVRAYSNQSFIVCSKPISTSDNYAYPNPKIDFNSPSFSFVQGGSPILKTA